MTAQGSYRARFSDPDGAHYGLPTYNRRDAPAGLATRRQLRAAGLAPGGHEPVAQVMWRQWRRDAVAYLYALDAAVPKRVPTPAQLDAVGKALAARRRCRTCGQDAGYCLPKTGEHAGRCVRCQTGLTGVAAA